MKNQIDEKKQSVETNLKVIDDYEQAGDYAHALKIARQTYQELVNLELTQQAANFFLIGEHLENLILTLGSSRLLFDENYQPRAKLLQLLQLVGRDPSEESENTLELINQWAQENLLRKKERWQERASHKFEELSPFLTPLLADLGFIKAISPHFTSYQGALVHGALLPTVRCRLYDLIQQWKQGVKFTTLYFLSGERPLEDQYENREAFLQDKGSLLKIKKDWQEPLEFPRTENEVIQLLWNQSEIPEEMRKQVKVYFINAPMKKGTGHGELLRPTTDDTITEWLKTSPSYGRYLAITNSPYINRQDLVIRTIAPKEYTFDTTGPAANQKENMAIFLDELARVIFQTKRLKNSPYAKSAAEGADLLNLN